MTNLYLIEGVKTYTFSREVKSENFLYWRGKSFSLVEGEKLNLPQIDYSNLIALVREQLIPARKLGHGTLDCLIQERAQRLFLHYNGDLFKAELTKDRPEIYLSFNGNCYSFVPTDLSLTDLREISKDCQLGALERYYDVDAAIGFEIRGTNFCVVSRLKNYKVVFVLSLDGEVKNSWLEGESQNWSVGPHFKEVKKHFSKPSDQILNLLRYLDKQFGGISNV